MNDHDLKSILKKFNLNFPKDIDLQVVGERVQDLGPNQVLFFNALGKNGFALLENLKPIPSSSLIIGNSSHSKIQNYVFVPPENFLPLQKELLEFIYPLKNKKFKMVGVTGTNGKTTTTHLLSQMCAQAQKKVLLIGTLGIYFDRKKIREPSLTTPSLIELHKILFEFKNELDVLVMEVSAHALDQQRVYGFQFDAAAWTSFSQDHLDYFSSMETYFQAKEKIKNFLAPTASCFFHSQDEFLSSRLSPLTSFVPISSLTWKAGFPLFLKAHYNLQNLAMASQLFRSLYPDLPHPNLSSLDSVPGRLESVQVGENLVIVDYAHTPDGLENLLKGVRKSFEGKKIICIFGCGGDRDKAKRPMMGRVAEALADEVILTNDNPRGEDPLKIAQDIEAGMSKSIKILLDRREAIEWGISLLGKTSVLVLAGKGHETFIHIGERKIPHHDLTIAREILERKATHDLNR